MSALAGLRSLALRYDAFLVDLWGVIHDGRRPFPGVLDALRELSAARRRVVFVTNSSRTASGVTATLASMGIGPELYEAVVSSGDVTREALKRRDPAVFGLVPEEPRCLHVGDRAYVPWLFELGLRFVEDVGEADLIVATGSLPGPPDLVAVREQLSPAVARGVPLVCTNPDRVIPLAGGTTLGPGAVAAAYAELGARVFLYGKPHPPIYEAARRHLGDVPASRVVAIGDLLETDVAGARASGFASVLVTETGATAIGAASPTADDVTADMVLPRFAW